MNDFAVILLLLLLLLLLTVLRAISEPAGVKYRLT